MISELRLQYFRSYNDARFNFSPGVNIIVGPNASGKTNLLEAILVIARGSSYRVKDHELISFEQPWARLDATTETAQRTVKITAVPVSKSYVFDEKPYKRLTLAQTLPVVLFEPNHLTLLTGAPDQRRSYLDDLLEQIITNYASLRRNYRRVVAQRNALLKRAHQPTNEELFPWNLRLSELGAAVARARDELTTTINSQLQNQYQALSHSQTEVSVQYQTQFPMPNYETEMLRKLEHNLSVDKVRGFTTAGPHREDFTVFVGDHPAEETASRGETRTIVLALKTIELELLEQQRGTAPLLLLDDVFSELDTARRKALTGHLKKYQTFITTTDADVGIKTSLPSSQFIELS